jgi:hypothetical protein
MQSISTTNGREAVQKKRKRHLLIDGIFIVVVVLEGVGWIRTGYAHPVLD